MGKVMKNTDQIKSDFIKIADVESISSCSKRHIMEEIKRGNLKAFKPGKELLFRKEDIEKWILKKAV